MHLQPLARLTSEQYLFQERQAETQSEYFDGEIFAMAGASREHNQNLGESGQGVGKSIARHARQRLFQRYESQDRESQKVHLSRSSEKHCAGISFEKASVIACGYPADYSGALGLML